MATRLKRLGLQDRVGANAHERLLFRPKDPPGKSVIYHQDLGYLILGLRILDPENYTAKYLFRI